jgi:hypothetical protein
MCGLCFSSSSDMGLSIITVCPVHMERSGCEFVVNSLHTGVQHSNLHHQSRNQGNTVFRESAQL